MRHQKTRNKLSRDSAHRKALLDESHQGDPRGARADQTTEAKAKAVKPEVEKLHRPSQSGGGLHARRQALSALAQDKFAVHRLFEEVAPRYADRPGGYTRILRLGPRRSDATEMVFIELVSAELGGPKQSPMVTKLTLEYDGTNFAGWARQPELRTVQEVLEEALGKVLGERALDGGPLTLTVAGRTDRGVHAWGQVASYSHEAVDPQRLNSLLPQDVSVLAANRGGSASTLARTPQAGPIATGCSAARRVRVRARANRSGGRPLDRMPSRHAPSCSPAHTTSPPSPATRPIMCASSGRLLERAGAARESCSSSGSRRTRSCVT